MNLQVVVMGLFTEEPKRNRGKSGVILLHCRVAAVFAPVSLYERLQDLYGKNGATTKVGDG